LGDKQKMLKTYRHDVGVNMLIQRSNFCGVMTYPVLFNNPKI